MGATKDRAGPHGLTIVSDDSNIPICAVAAVNSARLKVFYEFCYAMLSCKRFSPKDLLFAAATDASLLQVIKVGTSSLVRPEQNTLNLSNLARLCEVVRELHAQKHRYVVILC